MALVPKPQEIYRHFKGNLYRITAVAEHTETGEQLVVYQALDGDGKTYARPLEMFQSEVDREKYPDANQKYRFELQNPGTSSDLDPLLVQFLDADSYEERLNIMAGLHHRVTNEMITTMAVACDIEVPDGELEERFASLKTALLTLEKYECNRLR